MATLTAEHRAKISASLKGKAKDPAWREKIAKTLLAKPRVERKADCHPDMKHHCKGLCITCYTTKRHAETDAKSEAAKARRREQRNESCRRWQEVHGHDRHLRRMFGITSADYDRMLASQNGRCGVCGIEPTTRRLCVDHCHQTGRVRGLLCSVCNLVMARVDEFGAGVADRLRDYARRGES